MNGRVDGSGSWDGSAGTCLARLAWLAALICALAIILLLVVWSIFPSRRTRSHLLCHGNMLVLASALDRYLGQSGGAMPPATNWSDLLAEYLREERAFFCPTCETGRGAYAYNAALSGTMYSELLDPAATVVFFESDAVRPSAGGPELLPAEPRHYGGDEYAFTDGHTQWLARKRLGTDAEGNPIWAKEPDADVIWEVGAGEDTLQGH